MFPFCAVSLDLLPGLGGKESFHETQNVYIKEKKKAATVNYVMAESHY